MPTQFKLRFEGKPEIDVQIFQHSLPKNFLVQEREDGLYVTVPSHEPEDKKCQYLIDRELDRHFFLTAVKIRADMVRREVCGSIELRWSIYNPLPTDIEPQIWFDEDRDNLATQLRLWVIAAETTDIKFRLILLFQIIELKYPENKFYPDYENESTAPDKLTECKLIRNLIAHAGVPYNKQLKRYCSYLGLPERMHDPINQHYSRVIESKLPLMRSEAKKVIVAKVVLREQSSGVAGT